MADENIEGMKQDLAYLRTRLATLEGLLDLSGQAQLSDRQNGLLHSDQEIDGGAQAQDNGVVTDEDAEENPVSQALQLAPVANEDGHFMEGTLETSESAGHKRKSGWKAINAKKRRITRVDGERVQGPDRQDTLERPVENEAMSEDIRDLVASVLSRDAIKRLVEAVEYSKRPPAERARKPLD
ncbi:hypothetical protein ACHAPT_002270 [Fusarium lateritium]